MRANVLKRWTGVRNRGINPKGFNVSQIKFYFFLVPIAAIMVLPILFEGEVKAVIDGLKEEPFGPVDRQIVHAVPFGERLPPRGPPRNRPVRLGGCYQSSQCTSLARRRANAKRE